MPLPRFIWLLVALAAAFEIARALWSGGDLAYLPLIASAFALLGLNLARCALFHDPHPGKDLCPACLYETTAIRGLTCPECGHKARSAHDWRKRPKRWGLAAAGLAVVLALPAAIFAKRAVAAGFWPAWHSTPLILLLPALPVEAWSELESRLLDDPAALSTRQRAALARTCRKAVDSERDMLVRLSALDLLMWLEPESVSALRAFRAAARDPDPFVADWAVSKCRASWFAREVAALINDADLEPARRAELIWTAHTRGLSGPEIIETLERALSDPNPAVREAAAETLAARRRSARRLDSGGGLGWNWCINTNTRSEF